MSPPFDPNAFARVNLCAYAIAQNPRYQVAPHHRAIARKLEAVERGEIRRLMIFAPPRHGKSHLTSELFPAWVLGRNPLAQVISSTYSQDLSDDIGRRVRDMLSSEAHVSAFGRQLSASSSSVSRFHTTAGGVYVGVGIGGPTTGRGANIFLVDDPIKNAQDAQSPLVRKRHKDWFRTVAYTRLMPDAAVIIIMTRWNDDDLCGWILSEAAQRWDVLSLPALALDDRDPLGRAIGDPLWPDWFGAETLADTRRTIGAKAWASLYEQRPSPESGEIFSRSWVRYYSILPARFDEICASWDLAFKGLVSSDPVCGQVWGRIGSEYYLLDQVCARMDIVGVIAAMRAQRAKWPTIRAVYVEDKANGPAVMKLLEKEIPRMIAVNPEGGKIARAYAVSPMWEAGNVYLPRSAPWVGDMVEEVCRFPSAAHDDQVDTMTQALSQMSLRARAPRGELEKGIGL